MLSNSPTPNLSPKLSEHVCLMSMTFLTSQFLTLRIIKVNLKDFYSSFLISIILLHYEVKSYKD